jgi:NAD(P)-dependent dehydrogenase (short-subunit alcohol dehydrogenase family)
MGTMLVTGGSRGIGAAIVRAAAADGWQVVLTYSADADAAAAVEADVVDAGGSARAVRCDVASEHAVVALFAELADDGGVDCLVNNAGVAPGYGPFADIAVTDIEHILRVNVTGAFVCAREAVRHMALSRGGRGGCIVNISSKAAVLGGSGEWIHYAASKGAVETMTVGLAKEVAADGIRVNGVRPGLIAGGFGPWDPAGRVDAMRAGIPMQREGDPSEIAAAVVWLASPAASYVTGAIIDVTGGR